MAEKRQIDRRRAPRLPVALKVQLQLNGWNTYNTDNISWRGLYVRGAPACPTGLSLETRIFLPDDTRPLELVTSVARSIDAREAQTPGLGLDFHYLQGGDLARWEAFILESLGTHLPPPPLPDEVLTTAPPVSRGTRGSSQTTQLSPVVLAGASPGFSGRDPLASAGLASLPRSSSIGGRGVPTPRRASLILRAYSRERLQLFLAEELVAGRFTARIPYRVEPGAAVDLRVIHPDTEEEFVLAGTMRAAQGPGQLTIRFDTRDVAEISAFRTFIDTGRAAQRAR